MKTWRTNERNKLNYRDSEYLRPAFGWVKHTFIYALMMIQDRYFYDPAAGKYTVDRYLDDLEKRYGGIDAVLIWPTYPNIGIDKRNQFDLLADMPGGIAAVRRMVIDFRKRGVRVFFPVMIWDRGTHAITLPMPVALMEEMKRIGADGMNGDTMAGVPEDFRSAYDSLDYPVALQPEWSISDLKMVEWNRTSFGYYWSASDTSGYPFMPGVSVYKWLEPRHQVFVTNRWVIDKTDDLQYAFFNGVGYDAWENIWGIWNPVPERYGAAIRRIAAIYRQFPGTWNSTGWEPYFPTLQKGVFASMFPGPGKTVYTLVNRDSADREGRQLRLPYKEGLRYFDLWNGTALTPQRTGNSVYLSFPMEGRDFGAVLAIESHAPDVAFNQFLTGMHALAGRPLKSLSAAWKPLPQQVVAIGKTSPAVKTPKNMVLIPATGNYTFTSDGVMIEGNELPAALGVQHPWEDHPARSQKHLMEIASFYIDKYPVTNSQFKIFLDETKYHPKDDHHFLKDWTNGMYPRGWDNKPVTWVSLEDARAYAAWAGKRLPHEWEWQYAAQGNDGRPYPWGNEMDAAKVPIPDSGRTMRPPADVSAFTQGASPFGVTDMTGNVWQWTDEYRDAHTRAAILKGGSYYRPKGNYYSGQTFTGWYFPQAKKLNEYGKYLLMAPGMDRSATIGFRCVKDI